MQDSGGYRFIVCVSHIPSWAIVPIPITMCVDQRTHILCLVPFYRGNVEGESLSGYIVTGLFIVGYSKPRQRLEGSRQPELRDSESRTGSSHRLVHFVFHFNFVQGNEPPTSFVICNACLSAVMSPISGFLHRLASNRGPVAVTPSLYRCTEKMMLQPDAVYMRAEWYTN